MSRPRIILDPDGLYARLGVLPWSSPSVITAAYRRKARLLHPDVHRTGDAEAFMALKQAYDVLKDPHRRASYDASGHEDVRPSEIDPTPYPDMVTPTTRHPRLGDLPVAVWAGMIVLLGIGVAEIGMHLPTTRSQAPAEAIRAAAPNVPPPSRARAESDQAPYGAAPVRLAGTPNYYVTAAASPAVLWRTSDAGDRLVPWGQLPPFSGVQGLRILRTSGMVEVRVTETANGFIEAARLMPGDTAAASEAWCTFHAGVPPLNGEILGRGGVPMEIEAEALTDAPATGAPHPGQPVAAKPDATKPDAAVVIGNRSGQPMVVKLRGASGGLLASVFLAPGGDATVDRLPPGPASVDFATGEVWSRPCHGFTAGMHARRLPGMVSIGAGTRLAIPPDRTVTLTDLPERAFMRE